MKEANAEAKGLYNAGIRLLDPTSKRTKLKELFGKYESPKEKNKAAKSRSDYARIWLQNAKRCRRTDTIGFFNASGLRPSSSSSASVLQPSPLNSSGVAREPPMQIADAASIEIEDVHMEDTFADVLFGHISYGSSEWFWAMNGPAAPPRQPEQLMSFFVSMSL